MKRVNQVFTQLDNWRHLPTYQLERRADIFFSLYLREILAEVTGSDIHEVLIPEFPLHKRTLDREKGNNQSFRVDYLAFSSNLEKVWFVELKTDGGSSRLDQTAYLKQAKKVGFHALVDGLMQIVEASSSKRKYLHLLRHLHEVGVIINLDALDKCASKGTLQGFTGALREVRFMPPEPEVDLVCIHPSEERDEEFDEWISFKRVQEVIQRHEDEISVRFAKSLGKWLTAAGTTEPPS